MTIRQISNDTPAISSACVTPGALFITKVSAAQITNITIAAISPRSIFY